MPISTPGPWFKLTALIAIIPTLVFSAPSRSRDGGYVMDSRKHETPQSEVIELNLKTLSSGDLRSLVELHASNLNPKGWLDFHYRNQSAEGIENRLRELAKQDPRFRGLEVSDTITRILVYDLRDRDVVKQIEGILKRGGRVEIIIDESNTTEFKLPTKKQMEKWTDTQKEQFLRQFDHNKDGKVEAEDVRKTNEMRFIGIEIFKKLQNLQKKYSADLLALNLMPTRLVPLEGQNFIPINHAKHTSVRILDKATGMPLFILGAEYNSNFTNTEKHGGFYPGEENQKRYIEGKSFELLPTAERYIQMGIEFIDLEILNRITREIFELDERALERIRKGNGFQTRQKEMPKTYIFKAKDGSFMDIRVHPSYGNRHDIKPWDAFTDFLGQPNIKPQGLAMSQFVFSNRKLRQAIDSVLRERGNFVDKIPETDALGKKRTQKQMQELQDHRASIVVNSTHGLAWYSQLWNTFSRLPHEISSNTLRLIPGLLSPLKKLSLTQRMFNLFEAGDLKMENIFRVFMSKEIPNTPKGAPRPDLTGNVTPVKLHSKAAAVWYRDQRTGKTRYRIYITSANASANAGVGTYEHTVEIDTDNRHLYESVQKHVMKVAQHRRTLSFPHVYLRTLLYSAFKRAEHAFQKTDRNESRFPFEWDKQVVKEFERAYKTRDTSKIIQFFENTHSRYSAEFSNVGKELVRLLKTYHRSGQPFVDDALYLLWREALEKDKGLITDRVLDLIRKHLKIADIEEKAPSQKEAQTKKTQRPRRSSPAACLKMGRAS